jgi:hypothetical protein
MNEADRARAAAFWSWWESSRSGVEAAVATGEWGDLAAEVSDHVEAVHPGLQWEVRPGRSSAHALCISGGGDPALRALTQRIVDASPPADADWEYHPVRLPHAGPVDALRLGLGAADLALADVRFGIEV